MVTLSATGSWNIGDMIVQLFFFIILIAIIVGIVNFVLVVKQRRRQLNRIEEKLDKLIKGG
ncbi:hypothetical protein [Halobacillus sp. Marseille-P3879]|uniref:hypothetical protein n=1 Tax=Halobacillus sp. Marseille-P3879 TaxID=2045014 RepID=UPI000C7E42F0|nr:hypothetical protein [Halobacillus sp. Marseille-P3879]